MQIIANIVDCKEHMACYTGRYKHFSNVECKEEYMGHTINLDGFAVNKDEQFFAQLFFVFYFVLNADSFVVGGICASFFCTV